MILNRVYFSSERRHYDSFPDFTPSSDANWCSYYSAGMHSTMVSEILLVWTWDPGTITANTWHFKLTAWYPFLSALTSPCWPSSVSMMVQALLFSIKTPFPGMMTNWSSTSSWHLTMLMDVTSLVGTHSKVESKTEVEAAIAKEAQRINKLVFIS